MARCRSGRSPVGIVNAEPTPFDDLAELVVRETIGTALPGVLADSQGQVNQVAAVPSLHTAFAVLTCLVLFPVARRAWQRAVLVGYAVLMPLVLVWAGEHYVVDTLLGAGYAAVVVLLVSQSRAALARILRAPTVTG